MLRAKEAKAISKSATLEQYILDQISYDIIAEASKGNYRANITSIHEKMKSEEAYFDYFSSLGYKISYLVDENPGLYIMW